MSAITTRAKQGGALLLEALIAILLFSVGILAIVGLQAMAVDSVSEAKYRTDASFLANQIIGEMWVNRANLAAYNYAGGPPPPVLQNWVAQVNATLPGAAVNAPTIVVNPGNQVTVTLFWQRPEDAGAPNPPPPHQFLVTAAINCC